MTTRRAAVLAALLPLLALTTPVAADTVYESEDFEASNGGFSSSDLFAWGVPTGVTPHSGAKLWATNLTGTVPDEGATYVLEHAINVPSHAGSLYLSWWDWVSTDGFDSWSVSIDDLSTEESVYYADSGSQETWVEHTVEVSEWAGEVVVLRFNLWACCTLPGIDGWYIDDYSLVGTDYYRWTFEGTDGGFTHGVSDSWQWGVPAYPAGLAPHSGTSLWGTSLTGPAEEPFTHDLRREIVVPSDSDLAFVAFWDWFGTDGSDLRLVYVDDGSLNLLWSDGADQQEWVYRKLDLTSWLGETVELVFRLDAGGPPPGPDGWYLDDIGVGDPFIFEDGFESGDTKSWGNVVP